jgi:hypothetical protein
MQTFGNPTGTITMDEIKQAGSDETNIMQDPSEESTGTTSDTDEATGEPSEADEPVETEESAAAAPADDQRATIADELGYDPANLTPKQAQIVNEVIAQLAESDTPAATTADPEANLTEIEREVRAAKATRASASASELPPTPPPPQATTPADADPIVLDPAQHYTAEAQLYSDSMDARLSEPQRRRAFEELREHRRYEFAKDLVYNLKSPVVLQYLRDQLLADVEPKLAQFDDLNRSASQYRSRQSAERSAIVQLSKLDKTDPDIAEFVKPSKDGNSTYMQVMRSSPAIAARVNRLGENPDYSDLPADRRAVLHEIDRIRLAHDLAPRSTKGNANASVRVAKVKAAAALVKRGTTVSTAAKAAAASIIAKRAAGAANGGGVASRGNGQRRFENPDAERLRIAANKSTSIFG